MPIYEYQCGKCGAVVEAIQKMGDPALETCGADCPTGDGTGPLSRMVSAANLGRGLISSQITYAPGAGPAASCNTCGMAPGSCASD